MSYITNDKREILNRIKCNYGLNENADQLLYQYLKESDDNKIWDLQKALIDYVVKDRTLCTYQPYWKYRRSFLKLVINIIEDINEELNETLLENYINIINSAQASTLNEDNYFMVVFPVDNKLQINDDLNKIIIIQQHPSIISNGTTGLHVWPACYKLVDYLKNYIHIFKRKTILELGCGLGLLGLNCLKICEPKKFIFTDCHSKVLSQLKINLEYSSCSEINESIAVEQLDWDDLNSCSLFKNGMNQHIDVILASDIVFDIDLIPALVNTLDYIWQNNSNKDLVLYIASTIRNPDTYSFFIKNLGMRRFKSEVIEKSICDLKNSSNSTPMCSIELLKVYR